MHRVALPGQQLVQHGLARAGHLLLELARRRHTGIAARAGLLVGPVGGDTMLGMLVHVARAHLHLHRLTIGADHDRVQRLVAVGLGLGDVVVELARHRRVDLVQPGQCGVAIGHAGDDHAQGPQVEHALQRQVLALHLLVDAVEMLGPALHLGRNALGLQVGLQRRAGRVDALLAHDACLLQALGQRLVAVGVAEAEGQVLQLPFDLPDAQPVGQRRKHRQRFLRQFRRAVAPDRRKPAQRLQPRGQAQQHHAQVARERQQHLAHPLGLLGTLVALAVAAGRSAPGRALQLHELARVADQAGIAVAEGLGDHLLRLVQEVAGIDQIRRRLQLGRAADALQDGCHAVGMRERVLAGIELLRRQQRLGKRTRANDLGVGMGRTGIEQCDDGRRRRALLHQPGLHESRKSLTTAIWSAWISVGAWPMPGSSTSRARGPRCVIAWAVSALSRSDCAPRISSVGPRSAS
mmetsp:Transcript_21669/g.84381  ORF Transcript_21669/g.84381 Transcript_21669/m.84381 type:complete len:464 (+) Transcript_21669:1574-2965(+)